MTDRSSTITAVLGPTNTGKTHLAIERMLGHASGMIGFPLRLLARENYDRVVRQKGARHVALITGEEKILPPNARYFVCTVESMPVDRRVDFLAVDEIQICGDPERGHVFTDRLLSARGERETMFLGSDIVRPLLRRLIPDAEFISRPRLSNLSYAGQRKITRLPRRSAVVAFSATDVYTLAELVRRQRGGAAVVLGALSPRTRNAQVEMYQAGEVDYLIATDAIGMGLNMDVDHVAFAEDVKFDGRAPRRLRPAELAQIAGRAGRHMNDGTFGVTAECPGFDEEVIEAIENHKFEPLRALYWRNTDLRFTTLRDLRRTLEDRPDEPYLYRKRDGEDQQALEALSRMEDVAARATAPARIRLLWDICQVPDFRKTLTEAHARLLSQIFLKLTEGTERLSTDWVADQVKRFDRTDGDIDTLVGRISHIRTWTYISNRADWVADPEHWQQTARAIEDRLSDALHERLTQRFVDKRAAHLGRKLKDDADLIASVNSAGEVMVEGHIVGQLRGLTFVPDEFEDGTSKLVLTAARRVLPEELARRARTIIASSDSDFTIEGKARIAWRGEEVARLERGHDPLSPVIRIHASDQLSKPLFQEMEERLARWLEARITEDAPALLQFKAAEISGPGRGVLFQVMEGLGVARADAVAGLLKSADDDARRDLGRLGLRFGTGTIYVPALLKPKAARLKAALWSAHHDIFPDAGPPPEGRVNVLRDPEVPEGYYHAAGYVVLGAHAIRADMAERLAFIARQSARKEPFSITDEMLSIAAVGHEAMATILDALGYRRSGEVEEVPVFIRRRQRAPKRPPVNSDASKAKSTDAETVGDDAKSGEAKRRRPKRTKHPKPKGQEHQNRHENRHEKPRQKPREKPIDENSPFAVLRTLNLVK